VFLGIEERGAIPGRGRNFSLHHRVHGYGAHPASYPVGTRGYFTGVERPGREADNSSPSNAEVKNAYNYTSTPQYVFMACGLVKHRESFIFRSYELEDRDWGVRFPVGAGNFSPLHRVQTDSGAQSASYPMGTRGYFPGGKTVAA
jgi:hypothetical protein